MSNATFSRKPLVAAVRVFATHVRHQDRQTKDKSMSNATFSRKPLVAAVLTTLAVFSAGAMAGETEEAKTNVKLTIGTAESTTDKTVAGTVQNEQT